MKRCSFMLFSLFFICTSLFFSEKSFSAPSSSSAPAHLEHAVEGTRKAFFQSYQSLWATNRMKERLKAAIEQAVDDETKDLTWGTTGIQVLFNMDDIIQKIQENFTYRFNADYEVFLRQFEEAFAEQYRIGLVVFYKNTIAANLSQMTDNPMQRAYIRRIAHEKLLEDGKVLTTQITAKLDDKHKLGVGTAKTAGGVAILLRKQIYKIMSTKINKKILAGGIGKLAASKLAAVAGSYVLPWVGVAVTLWGAWDITSTLWNAPEEMKTQMEKNLLHTFYEEVPTHQWEAMEEFIKDGFIEAHANIMLDTAEAERIVNNLSIQELSKNLTEDQKINFAERLSTVARTLHVSGDDQTFLEEYGKIILATPPLDFPVFLRILQENPNQLIPWYNLVKNKYFYFYSMLPSEIWSNYAPTEDSLKTITWIAQQIPESAKKTASGLQPKDVRWIMEELPERYLPNMFNNQKDANKIQVEIARLALLSDKDSRKPWQTEWEYRFAYYGRFVVIAFKAIAIIIALVIAVKIFFFIKRKRTPVEKTVVIHNHISQTPSSGDSLFEKLGVQRPTPPSQNQMKEEKENKS